MPGTRSMACLAPPALSCHRVCSWPTAVDAGVLAEHEARLILDTRVDGRTLPEVADELGLSYEAAKKRRRRAEARWAAWWLQDMGRVGDPGTGEGAA